MSNKNDSVSFCEKPNTIMMILVELLLCFMISFLISNSIITSGHIVNFHSIGNQNVVNCVGYENDGMSYKITDANHYITFDHENNSSEFSILFSDELTQDDDITVWYMTDDGTVISENNVLRKTNEYCLRLDVPFGTSLVSISTNSSFKLKSTISSDLYRNKKSEVVAFLIPFLICITIMLVLNKTKVSNVFYLAISDFVNLKKTNITKRHIVFFVSSIVYLVLVFVLWNLDECYPISVIARNEKRAILIVSLIYYIFFVILYRKSFAEKLPQIAFFTVFLMGLLFVLMEPITLGISWDDQIHYDKVSYVSHLVDKKRNIAETYMIDSYSGSDLGKANYYENYTNYLTNWYDQIYREGYFWEYNKININYKWIVYFPLIIGMIIARGFGCSFHMIFLMSELMNVFFCAICSYFIVKKTRYGELVPLLILTIPTVVFLSSRFNYDSWLITFSMLGFSFLFFEKQNDSAMQISSMIIIPISFYLAIVRKPIYFIMLIPAFVLKNQKFENNRKKWIYRLSVFLAMIIPFISVIIDGIVNAGEGDYRGGEGVNQTNQLDFIMNNKLYSIKVILSFLNSYLNPFVTGKDYVHGMAYNGVIQGGVLTIIVIIIGGFICHEDNRAFPIWYRICMVMLYFGVGLLCAVSLYAAFTPVGANYVAGCSPRYLLPVVFPTLYVLTRIPIKNHIIQIVGRSNIYSVFCVYMVFINCYCLWHGCVCVY